MSGGRAVLAMILIGIGSVLLLLATGALLSGYLVLIQYGIPVALLAVLAIYVGLRRLDRELDVDG